jgi:hypothetical protein
MTHTTAYSTSLTLTLAIVLAGPALHAQSPAPSAPGVSGSWKVSLHGQHIIPVGMELKQDGLKISGTLMLWNGDVALEGELVDGTMKVSGRLEPTDGTPAGDRIVTATILANGTLEGSFAGDHGQIKLTAERFTDRAARRTPAAPAATAPAPMPPAATDPAPFAGKWRLTAGAGSGGEPRTLDLELVVDGNTITGSVVTDHAGSLPIQNGRFADGTLKFGVPMGPSAIVEFAATLKGHGALSGSITGPMGPMSFIGERVK